MASKVNIKFVAILGTSLVLFAAVVGVAGFLLIFKSADEHIAIGDSHAEAGRWDQARRSYSKAVNKEPTNADYLVKWAESIQSLTPETETEYRDRLMNDLFAAYNQLAQVRALDVESQEQYLGFLFTQFQLAPATVERAIAITDRAGASLARFETSPPAENDWKTLYRFRGLPHASVLSGGGELEDEQLEQTRTDLELALEGDSTDEQVAIGLSWWHSATAGMAMERGDFEGALASVDASLNVLQDYLNLNPGKPQAMLELLFRKNRREIMVLTRGMLDADAREIARELQGDMALELPAVIDAAIAAPPESIEPQLITMLAGIEQIADPAAGLLQTKRLVEHLTAALPDEARVLMAAGDVDERRQDSESALSRYDAISEMENLPVSIEGILRISLRREAMFRRGRVRLDQFLSNPDDTNKQELLEQARADRAAFALQVSEDDTSLLALDAMLRHAEATIAANEPDKRSKLSEARELYRRYNEQTLSQDPRGLWRHVQVAIELGGYESEAESLLNRLLELQPGNRLAVLALAEVKFIQRDYAQSAQLFQTVLESDPSNTAVANRLQSVRAILNPEDPDLDPMLAAGFQADALRSGTVEVPGNLDAAASFLEGKIAELGPAEPLARRLIGIYLDQGKTDDARRVAAAAYAAFPESPQLARFHEALQSAESSNDAVLAILESSENSEIEKTINRYRVFLSQQRLEDAQAELAKAIAMDPEDPQVVEIRFENAIASNDLETAKEVSATAARLNLDSASGALYRARVLMAENNFDQATTLLQQVIAQGGDSSLTYRLLAGSFAGNGRVNEAIEAVDQALELDANDSATRLQRITLLRSAGRNDEALATAREAKSMRGAQNFLIEAWLELEAIAGDQAGRQQAIVRRQSIRDRDPDNLRNNAALTELLILNRNFGEAKPIIAELRAEEDSIGLVLLDMRWHADQGRLLIDDEPIDGLLAAQRLFQEYLLERSESELTADTYLNYARFMIGRDKADLAIPAIEQARALQDDRTREADKLLGELLYTNGRFAEALSIFQSLVDDDIDTANQDYRKRLIESAIRVNEYQLALAQLEQIEKPDLTTLLQRSSVLNGLDRKAEARSVLDQTAQEYPNDPLVYIRRAETNSGDPALEGDVQADLAQALRLDPDNWRALRLRGVLRADRDRQRGAPISDTAIADITAAIAANPQLETLMIGLMNELIKVGRDGQAADIADTALQDRPGDAQLMLNLARVFAGHELWNRAVDYTRQAWIRSQSPQIGVLLIDSLVKLESPRTDEAETVFEQIKSLLPPESAQSMLILATEATIRRAQGRENSTQRALTQAIDNIVDNPGDVLTWAQHVRRVYRNDLDSAASTMQRIAADPQLELDALISAWLSYVTAQALVELPERREDGVALLRTLRDRDDTDPLTKLAYRIEGTVWYSANDFERARSVWNEGIARFPNDWELLNNQAYMLASELDAPAEALPLAEQAVSLAGDQLSTHDTLGLVYIELARYEEAAEQLQEALKLADTPAKNVTVNLLRIRYHLSKGEIDLARQVATETRGLVFGTVGMTQMAAALDELEAEIDSAAP